MGNVFWLVGILAALAVLALLVKMVVVPWVRGKRGEAQIDRLVRSQLDPAVYHLVSDLTLSAPEGAAPVGHVIVSRYGIFVIESEACKGLIFGSESDAQWTQQVFGHRIRFPNPLRQTARHGRILAQLIKLPESCFIPLVVFADDCTFKPAAPESVVPFRGLIGFIKGHQAPLIQDRQVPEIVAAIQDWAGPASPAFRKQQGRGARKNRKPAKAGAQDVVCPTCGKAMVVRSGRRDGKKFWGCTGFPACRGVRKWGEA